MFETSAAQQNYAVQFSLGGKETTDSTFPMMYYLSIMLKHLIGKLNLFHYGNIRFIHVTDIHFLPQ